MSTVFVNILAQRFEEIICTDHSHVHDMWILTGIDIPQKESAQTRVMFRVFVNILVYKLEAIICTEHSHVNSICPFTGCQVSQQESCTDHSHVYNVWLFRCIDISEKEAAQTTVMSTTFGNLHAQTSQRKNLHRPQSC